MYIDLVFTENEFHERGNRKKIPWGYPPNRNVRMEKEFQKSITQEGCPFYIRNETLEKALAGL